MSSLSVVILTHNDAREISRVIGQVKFADEIIVIDDNSSDGTVAEAKKSGAHVILRRLDTFSNQRNFALSKAKSDWVFFVDSDEVISSELMQEIKNSIKSDRVSGYLVKRIDNFLGKELQHGDVGDVWILRLGRRGSGVWHGAVHEVWNIEGEVGRLRYSLIHNPHSSLREFVSKIDFYSSIRADELYTKRTKIRPISIVAYPIGKFLSLYVYRLGFRDGAHGFIHAMMMSFHSFLVRGKLYFLTHEQK